MIIFLPTIQIPLSAIKLVTVSAGRLKINNHILSETDSIEAIHALTSCGFYAESQKDIVLNELNKTSYNESPIQNPNDYISAVLDNYDFRSIEDRNAAFMELSEAIDKSHSNLHSIIKKYEPIPFVSRMELLTTKLNAGEVYDS